MKTTINLIITILVIGMVIVTINVSFLLIDELVTLEQTITNNLLYMGTVILTVGAGIAICTAIVGIGNSLKSAL